MKLKSILVTVLLFLFFFSPCRTSFADGGYIPGRSYAKLPDIPIQRALLKYRDGVETLIIESPFDGKGDKFAWIIPIPSKPHRFEKITPGLLKTISFALQPMITHRYPTGIYIPILLLMFLMSRKCVHIIRRKSTSWTIWKIVAYNLKLVIVVFFMFFVVATVLAQFGAYRGGGPLPSPASVKVESWQVIGDYEISVLTAHDSGDLNTWLANNGYRELPEKALPIVDDYIEKKWVFVAAKIIREDEGTSAPHPILIEFKSKRPVYPMRFTALSGSPVNLELLTLASTQAVPINYNLKQRYCDYFDHEIPPNSDDYYAFADMESTGLSRSFVARNRYSRELRYAHTIGHPKAMELMWDGSVITKLVGKISSDEMQSDMFFSFKNAVPSRSHFFSSSWAFRTGLISAIFVGLFGCQIISLYYVKNSKYPAIFLLILIITCISIFSIIYLRTETVDVTKRLQSDDWDDYSASVKKVFNDYIEEIVKKPNVEITDYLKNHAHYLKNPLSNKPIIIEDSPGNIIVTTKGIMDYVTIHLRDGTPVIWNKFVGHVPDSSKIEDLVALAKTGDSFFVTESAGARLKGLIDDRGMELLVTGLEDSDRTIRIRTVRALGKIGDRRVVKPLIAALLDRDRWVRKNAAMALGQMEIGSEHVIAELMDLEYRIRNKEVWALVRSEDEKAVSLLSTMLDDEDSRIRRRAAWMLGQIKSSSALQPLLVALKDQNERVRAEAAAALGQLKKPRAIKPLIMAMGDNNKRVRSHARYALRKIDDPGTVEELISALHTQNSLILIV